MNRDHNTELHVSASAIRTLQSCSKEFYYKYISGFEPEHVSANMLLGSAIHQSIAYYYKCMKENARLPTAKEMTALALLVIDEAVNNEKPILFSKDHNHNWLRNEVSRLLTVFEENAYKPFKVLGVEERFSIPVYNPVTGEVLPYNEKLVGYIDLIAQEQDGSILIVDHKVVSRCDKTKAANADVQMALYSVAVKQLYNVDTVKLAYQNIKKTKTAKLEFQGIKYNSSNELEAIEAVVSALELIGIAVSHPKGKTIMSRLRSWKCKDCMYRERCSSDIGIQL